MIREDKIISHKFKNFIHSTLLFLSMIILLALLGFLLAGIDGVIWASFIGIFIFVISSNVSPRLILRMYRARPLSLYDAPNLYQIIKGLSYRANLPVIPKPYYIPSKIMNAFSVGTRDNPAIGLTDGLLQELTIRELVGVLAHEISHIRNNDMKVMGFADIISRVTSIR